MLNKGTKVSWNNGLGKWSGVVVSSLNNPNGADNIKVLPDGNSAGQYVWVGQNMLAIVADPLCSCRQCAEQRA